MKNKLEYRMYGLVPYNLSPIQQGIQYGHAVVEYCLANTNKEDFKKWSKHDKTFIILNGGTTNNGFDIVTGEPKGSLNKHLLMLNKHKINFSTFHEPDLGDQLTAVVFLVDERVFDRKKYPNDYDINVELVGDWTEGIPKKELKQIMFLREFLPLFRFA
jgi:hypothetical protein